MRTILNLNNIRISYPHLFTPRALTPDDKAKYSASFWIPKGSDADKQVQEAVRDMMKQAKEGPDKIKLSKPVPYYDGADRVGEEAMDYMILNSSSTRKPATVDQATAPVDNEDFIYPGCYVNAHIALYDYRYKTGNGLAFGLNGVQFVKDGARFDGAQSASTMFAPVEGAPEAINSAFS